MTAAAPTWLVDLITERPTPVPGPTFTAVNSGDRPGDRWADTVTWHDLLTADGWTHHHTDRNGEDHWTRPGKDTRDGTSATTGYQGSDVLKVFTSSMTANGLRAEETYTKVGYIAATRHDGDFRATAQWCRDQQPAQWGTSIRINTTAPGPTADPAPFTDDPSRIVWADLWAMDPDADDWLISPFVARGRGHALYAPAKAGKSLFVLNMVARAAAGWGILDHPADTPIRTLYLDLEMADFDVRERLADMGFGPDVNLEPLAYYSLPALPTLDTAEGGQRVLDLARAHGAQLVVIDTMSRVIGGEEDSADTLRAFFRHTGSLLKAARIATVRIDHAGKDLERGMRGTSAKADDVDVVWQLLPRDGGRFDLKATHRRMGWVPESVHLDQRADPLTYTVADDSWPAGTKEAADLLDALGVPLAAGKGPAGKALREDGRKVQNTTLLAALRWRRSRPAALIVPGVKDTEMDGRAGPDFQRTTPPAETSGPPSGPVRTSNENDALTSTSTGPEMLRTSADQGAAALVRFPPPLRGGPADRTGNRHPDETDLDDFWPDDPDEDF